MNQEILKTLVEYNPETGEFFWLERGASHFPSDGSRKAWNTRVAGTGAGTVDGHGYMIFGIFNKLYKAHRLAWLYVHGEWPKDQIDHINGDRSDNRMENLRAVSRSENMRNQKLREDNSSGCTGVSWSKTKGKWRAYIFLGSRIKHLGYFAALHDAVSARKSAETLHGYHANHGRAEAA